MFYNQMASVGIIVGFEDQVESCFDTETEEEKSDSMDREGFNRQLSEYYETKVNKKPFTRKTLGSLLEEIQVARGKRFRKDRREYHILKTYDTSVIEGREQVIRKIDQLPIIAFEDLYDTILEYHISTNHGGKTRLEAAYKQGKVNVPRPATEVFLQCCRRCSAKKNAAKKVPVEKPKYTRGFSHKAQIHIMDFHETPDGVYSAVLAYQDHYTNFLVLRPLKNASPQVVADELVNIFMLFGAPKILGCGDHLVLEVLELLGGMWSEDIFACMDPIVMGRALNVVEDSIRSWVEANPSADWAAGLNAVQWQENVSKNSTIGRSPYQAVFGFTPRLHPLPPTGDASSEEDIKPDVTILNGRISEVSQETAKCPNGDEPGQEEEILRCEECGQNLRIDCGPLRRSEYRKRASLVCDCLNVSECKKEKIFEGFLQ